jgi:hypothetical protein
MARRPAAGGGGESNAERKSWPPAMNQRPAVGGGGESMPRRILATGDEWRPAARGAGESNAEKNPGHRR